MNHTDEALARVSRGWPHAPLHRLSERGAYIVTAGTYLKKTYLDSPDRLDLLLDSLFFCADEFGWSLQAWAILNNHYHFVAMSPPDSMNFRRMIGKLHMTVGKAINLMDAQPGRKIWYQYWESRITYQRSYLARLKYVHQNPVHHGIVTSAVDYPWCSAAWFEREATTAFVNTINGFKIDQVKVRDDF